MADQPYRRLHPAGNSLQNRASAEAAAYDCCMSESQATPRPVPWLWIAFIWLGFGLIDASQTVFPMRVQGMHHKWVLLFLVLVADWLPWALATPLVMRLGRRHSPFRSPALRTISLHAGLVIIVDVVTAAWSALLEVWLDPWSQTQPPKPYTSLWVAGLVDGLLTSLIVYGFILAITFAMESAERVARQRTEAAELGEQLAKAQLEALRQQMDPHFMFNTLNAISGLVRDEKNHSAVSMIAGLSDLLRRSALDTHRPQVTLGEEVDYLQRYLDIQRVRFAERLQVAVDIAPELYSEWVPNLILQPLVENAIKHGIAKRVEGGAIRVAARLAQDTLHLSVYNDGPRLPDDWEAASGIGLSNLRTRLRILYGTRFDLNLRSPEFGGVEVAVSLPLRRA
jgi:two-component system, LytTR family, sensor kinase